MIRDIEWQLATPMPAALKGHAQAAIGNDIVLCCGTQFVTESPGDVRRGGATALGRTGWILDTSASRYDRLPDAPLGVKWAGGAAVGDDFYVLTGMVPDNNASPRMFRLSRSSTARAWHEMPPMNTGRLIPGIAVAGTTIHVVGGEGAGGPAGSSDAAQSTVDTMEMFDTATPKKGWVRGPSLPGAAREAMGIATIGNTIYAFGGLNLNPANTSGESPADPAPWRLCADAYAYDADHTTWRRLPDLPFPCYGWQASPCADRYVILAAGVRDSRTDSLYATIGAGKPTQPNHRVLVYDTVTMTFRELPTRLPAPLVVSADSDMADGYADAGQRERAGKYVAAVREVSKTMDLATGGFRISPGLSIVGTTLYMAGGECLTPHAGASDELLIGRIVTDGQGRQ